MTNQLAKSRVAWMRTLLSDADLCPSARIMGLFLGAVASTRGNHVEPRIDTNMQRRLAISPSEAQDGFDELLQRRWLTPMEGVPDHLRGWVNLTFPAGRVPG